MTYDVSDSSDNAAVQVVRTVNVVDTTVPVISLLGANPQVVDVGSPYVELGATVADNQSAPVVLVVDTSGLPGLTNLSEGSYQVFYDATDDEANPDDPSGVCPA